MDSQYYSGKVLKFDVGFRLAVKKKKKKKKRHVDECIQRKAAGRLRVKGVIREANYLHCAYNVAGIPI